MPLLIRERPFDAYEGVAVRILWNRIFLSEIIVFFEVLSWIVSIQAWL